MGKPKLSTRQEFESDLEAVVGDRHDEFSPKLVEMLYSLWREGSKRGAKRERDSQAERLSSPTGRLLTDPTMQERLREMTGPHPAAKKADTRTMFEKVLAGDEPILKVPESPGPFPTLKVPDFMVTTTPNREFFGEWLKEKAVPPGLRVMNMEIKSNNLGQVPKIPIRTRTLGPSRLPPLKSEVLQTKKKKLNVKPK
jgi:hypothetical protein